MQLGGLWGTFPHFLQGDGIYHCSPALPASLAPLVPQGDATEPFLPLFLPPKQGKEGGNSKAKGKNKTTKHRIICIFHHLAEGMF